MAMIAPAWIEVRGRLVQPDESVQPDGDRVLVEVPGEVDERLEEVVPGEEEVEQGDGDDRRPGLRDDDRHQDAQGSGAVDRGRLVELAGDRHEELAEQEHVEGVGEEVRDDQRQPRADPTEALIHGVGRNDRDEAGQDDGGDQRRHDQLLERDVEARQSVGDEHGRDQRPGHAEPGDDAGVEQQLGKVEDPGHGREVVPVKIESGRRLERAPAALPLDEDVGFVRDRRITLASRPLSTRASSRVPSSNGTIMIGYSSPSIVAVSGDIGRIGWRGSDICSGLFSPVMNP